VVVQDNQPSRPQAAPTAKKLLSQDKVIMLVNTSLSRPTRHGRRGQARQGAAVLRRRGLSKDTYPPADPLQFCSTAFGANLDSQAALAFVKNSAKEPVRLGLAPWRSDRNAREIEYAEGLSRTLGMTPWARRSPRRLRPITRRSRPSSRRKSELGVFGSPWVSQVRTFEALRRLGWSGRYIT